MIFNNLRKRANAPDTIQLQGLSTANLRKPSLDATEDLQSLEVDDLVPHTNGAIFCYDDFVFLSDNVNCWVVRVSDISLLEACGNYTRVYFNDATALIRRPLRECECKLDPSTFFRTRRDCVVNLSRVKQMRMLDAKRFLFVLLDGKEVPMSRKQSLIFRKTKAL
jgi:DNA-binding LytR/AlgR family response regulator